MEQEHDSRLVAGWNCLDGGNFHDAVFFFGDVVARLRSDPRQADSVVSAAQGAAEASLGIGDLRQAGVWATFAEGCMLGLEAEVPADVRALLEKRG